MSVSVQRKLAVLFQNQKYSFWFFLAIFLIFRNLSFFVLFFLAICYLKINGNSGFSQGNVALNEEQQKLLNRVFTLGLLGIVPCYFLIKFIIPIELLEVFTRGIAFLNIFPDAYDQCILSDVVLEPNGWRIRAIEYEYRVPILVSYLVVTVSYVWLCFVMSCIFKMLDNFYYSYKVISKRRLAGILFLIIFMVGYFLFSLYGGIWKDCMIFDDRIKVIAVPFAGFAFWILSLSAFICLRFYSKLR